MSDLLNDALIFTGSAFAVVAAVAIGLRRRQERSILLDWADRHGWNRAGSTDESLRSRLASSALMQIGHSRHISAAVRDPNDVELFEYWCETGLEHDRQSHRWIGVVVPIQRNPGRAVFSTEQWVVAAALTPSLYRLDQPAPRDSPRTEPHRTALVEDPVAWQSAWTGEFAGRLAAEAPQRSWEVLADCILGYQAAPVTDDQIVALLSAAKELAKLI